MLNKFLALCSIMSLTTIGLNATECQAECKLIDEQAVKIEIVEEQEQTTILACEEVVEQTLEEKTTELAGCNCGRNKDEQKKIAGCKCDRDKNRNLAGCKCAKRDDKKNLACNAEENVEEVIVIVAPETAQV